MQPHDEHQRPETQPADGGRDAERSAAIHAIGVAFAKVFDMGNGQMHLAEPGKPVNMSASVSGSGGLAA